MSSLKLVVFNGDYTIFSRAANDFLAEFFVAKYPEIALEYARENYGCNDFLTGFRLCEFMLRKYKGIVPPKEMLNHFEQNFFGPIVLGWRKNLSEVDFANVELSFYQGIQETVDVLHQKGIATAIFSSGPFSIHDRARKKFKIGYCNATPIIFKKGKYAGEGQREWNKGIVLAKHIKETGFAPEEVAVIEHSDVNMCKAVMDSDNTILGRIILLNRHKNMESLIKKHKDDERFHVVESNDLRKVLPFLV